jgi:Flagellar hook-length control protein FliK
MSQGLDIATLAAAMGSNLNSGQNTVASSMGGLPSGTPDFGFLNLLMSMNGFASIYDDTDINKAMIQELQDSRDQRLERAQTQATQEGVASARKPQRKPQDDKEIPLDETELSAITGITPAWLQELLKSQPIPAQQAEQDGGHRFDDTQALTAQLKDIFSPPPIPVNMPLTMLQQLPNHIAATVNSSGFSKTQTLSKDFVDMIQKAYQKQRPIRVSISDDTTLVLKFNRQGQVSAHFLASDSASELYLKQHLSDLRQRLDAKGLPVDQLTVTQTSPDGRRRQGSSQSSSSEQDEH